MGIEYKINDSVAKQNLTDAQKTLEQAAETAAEWAAQDVRNAVRRLIKSGGKNERSKNWRTSAPGEPPLSHIGTLKRSIMYEKDPDGGFRVGAPALGSSRLARTLEEGGVGSRTTRTLTPAYFRRKFQKRRSRPRNRANDRRASKTRPAASRPYRVYTSDRPTGKLVRDYLYFYSSSAWEAARNSSGFQAWARSVSTTSTLRFPVAPRPYVEPAFKAQTTQEKMQARIKRALRSRS